jgi:hypothetical protein
MLGALRDGLFAPEPDFTRIDDVDCREWLTRHGAHAQTLESPLMRGLYDLVFAYEDGDTSRPRFAAGLALFLAMKLFFDYKGAIFWKLARYAAIVAEGIEGVRARARAHADPWQRRLHARARVRHRAGGARRARRGLLEGPRLAARRLHPGLVPHMLSRSS